MDLEDWEILPDDGLLQVHDDGGKMIFSRKYTTSDDSKNEFNMNYFICPTSKPSQFVDTTQEYSPRVPNQIVPFQVFQETPNDQEAIKVPRNIVVEEVVKGPNFGEHHEQFSQVFFKKMKESEFDQNMMKMDSPKSNNKTILSQVDADDDPFEFEEKEEQDMEVDKEMVVKKIEENNNGGVNLLSKSLNGIGAICSFGVAAAATICIIFMGNHQKHKQSQKLRFQIFTDDKRIKQVVHHATRLNEAFSAVRGAPVTRAHITVGGYYDVL